jgi:hypothetical protein
MFVLFYFCDGSNRLDSFKAICSIIICIDAMTLQQTTSAIMTKTSSQAPYNHS